MNIRSLPSAPDRASAASAPPETSAGVASAASAVDTASPLPAANAARRGALAPAVTEDTGYRRARVPGWLPRVLAPLLGLALFVWFWALVADWGGRLPGPLQTWHAALPIFGDPFYVKGPNDQGIGWNVLSSLERVGLGFGLAALVGIPLGFLLGRFGFLSDMAAPVIALLRPVSPLAWLPIGLLVFQAANPAAIYVIFISSIWPMIINTAVGVRQVPQDYLNVARVLNLSEWKVFTKILLPAALPYMITGVRLSIGIAWLVIVAAEMLTGGAGIGFWVWDEWNNLKVEHIIVAIFVIGAVGLLLESALLLLARRVRYT
jgi:nitrate/nitrite transport system permease protein